MNLATGSNQNTELFPAELIDNLFEGKHSLTPEEIGTLLVENNLLKKEERELFLKCLNGKLPTSREYKALLHFLVDPADEGAIKVLSHWENWDLFQNLLLSSGCAPLFHFHHSIQSIYGVSFQSENKMKTIVRACRKSYETTDKSNRKTLEHLNNIIYELNKNGIFAIILKGGYLATAVYPEVGLRPMSDLDLLIRRKDLPAAYSVLKRLALKPEGNKFIIYYNKLFGYHQVFLHTGKGLCLEIHWNLFLPLLPIHFSIEEVWKRAISFPGSGFTGLALSPEDNLVFLASHFEKHCLFLENIVNDPDPFQALIGLQPKAKLKWLVDIYFLIARFENELDWEQVVERTWKWNLTNSVGKTLTLINLIWGPIVPESVINSLRKNNDYQISTTVRNWLFQIRRNSADNDNPRTLLLRKLFFNQKKNLPYQFGPRTMPEIIWYFFPNKNYFLQMKGKGNLLKIRQVFHFFKALSVLLVLAVNTGFFLLLTERIFRLKTFSKSKL